MKQKIKGFERLSSKRCPYCHDVVKSGAKYECEGCEAVHHFECWEAYGGCTTIGCCRTPRRVLSARSPKMNIAAHARAIKPNSRKLERLLLDASSGFITGVMIAMIPALCAKDGGTSFAIVMGFGIMGMIIGVLGSIPLSSESSSAT